MDKISTISSVKLRESIQKREKQIFSNIVILTATYLDKRFFFLLTPEEITREKNFVRSIIAKFNCFDEFSFDAEIPLDASEEKNDSFEKKMQELAGSSSSSMKSSINVLQKELNAYEKLDRLKTSESIMKFWINRSGTFPLLSSAAIQIISAPVTEVSVERLFSNLNFILNNADLCSQQIYLKIFCSFE